MRDDRGFGKMDWSAWPRKDKPRLLRSQKAKETSRQKQSKPEESFMDPDRPVHKATTESKPIAETKNIKARIKLLCLENRDITVDEIMQALGDDASDVSRITVSNVRAEFRLTLRLLEQTGWLRRTPRQQDCDR